MAYATFDQKRPNSAEVFGFDLTNNIGLDERITNATTVISLKEGVTDINMASMNSTATLYDDVKIWQKVTGGVDGNYYFITFTVTTTRQTFEVVGVIPVSTKVTI